MPHDVFISYSSKDNTAANTICAALEGHGIRCWIAPRDIIPGVPWAESIIDALHSARLMVVVFSHAANASVQIQREVERAVHKNVPVVPVRIDSTLPSKSMEYFISSSHWFDAIDPPLAQHVGRFAEGVQALLSRPERRSAARRKQTKTPAPARDTAAAAGVGPVQPAGAPIPPDPLVPSGAAIALGAANATREAAVPSTLGNYDLGAALGPGRFGSMIYAGTHRLMGNSAAIRTFRAGPLDNRAAVRDRFLKEARSLQVQHPNILHVRDFGEQDDVLYIVTDLVAGCSLSELLATEGPLAIPKLRQFVAELADATVAVHTRGGLISGLHPEIIRVVREEGTERLAISSAGVQTAQDILSTMKEAVVRGQASSNELLYVAPELLMGKSADPATDVYTIGTLAYHMASGRPPFQANSLPELLGTILGTSPAPLESIRPELPPSLGAVIMRSIEKDRSKRYATAAEVLEAWRTSS